MVNWFEWAEITLADTGLDQRQESILLKSGKESYWDVSTQVEYDDTNLTESLRSQMYEINSWIVAADIQVMPAGCDTAEPPIDLSKRHLRRYFTRGVRLQAFGTDLIF